MKKYFKKSVNSVLSKFGWKLIKFRKIPEPNPFGKIDINLLNAINESKGIIHLGAHRGSRLKYIIGLEKM